MSTSTRKKRKILFLAANPKDTAQLDLVQEKMEIAKGLERANKRDKFTLEEEWALTPEDLQRAMLKHKPQIVHFSGHGAGDQGLVLEDGNGQAKLVSGKALAEMFDLFMEECKVECVILNACHSQIQADAIAQYVPYVVGMNQAIGDRAARVFAVAFYDGLGDGRTFEFSFKLGRNRIGLEGISEEFTPVMCRKEDFPAREAWTSTTPTPVVTAPVVSTPEPSRSFTPVPSSSPPTEAPVAPPTEAPIPAEDLDVPEGCVSLTSRLYVERQPIEVTCFETILRPGALIRVKAPRQMGKSSLMARIIRHAKQNHHQIAYLNFQLVEPDCMTGLEEFLKWFCVSITDALDLDFDRLEASWKGGLLGPKRKCTKYLQAILTDAATPMTLAMDEVDQAFQQAEIFDGFFSMLRTWHENAKTDEIWQRLRMIITHSQEVYIPMNINQSPFNVGLPVELPELNREQVMDLVQRHGLQWSEPQINQLMNVVDGHPYLLRRALYEIALSRLTLEDFIRLAPTEEGPFEDHLRRHLHNLQQHPELQSAMHQVSLSEGPIRIDSTVAFKLRSMGLIEMQGNDVIPLCNLYRTYFRDRLQANPILSL